MSEHAEARMPALQDPPDAWLVTGDLECLACSYNLRGRTGPDAACPECGFINDLRDPRPWAERQVDVGLRKRSHWPTESVAASLLAIAAAAIVIGVVFSAGFLSIPGIGSMLLFGVFTALWVSSVRRWVVSCTRIRPALLILVMYHLGAWTTIAFIVVCSAAVTRAIGDGTLPPSDTLVFLLVSGILGGSMLWSVFRMMRRGEENGLYRDSPKNHRLPLGSANP